MDLEELSRLMSKPRGRIYTYILENGTVKPSSLKNDLNLSYPLISHHIKVLCEAGMLGIKQDRGKRTRYVYLKRRIVLKVEKVEEPLFNLPDKIRLEQIPVLLSKIHRQTAEKILPREVAVKHLEKLERIVRMYRRLG